MASDDQKPGGDETKLKRGDHVPTVLGITHLLYEDGIPSRDWALRYVGPRFQELLGKEPKAFDPELQAASLQAQLLFRRVSVHTLRTTILGGRSVRLHLLDRDLVVEPTAEEQGKFAGMVGGPAPAGEKATLKKPELIIPTAAELAAFKGDVPKAKPTPHLVTPFSAGMELEDKMGGEEGQLMDGSPSPFGSREPDAASGDVKIDPKHRWYADQRQKQHERYDIIDRNMVEMRGCFQEFARHVSEAVTAGGRTAEMNHLSAAGDELREALQRSTVAIMLMRVDNPDPDKNRNTAALMSDVLHEFLDGAILERLARLPDNASRQRFAQLAHGCFETFFGHAQGRA